MIRFFKKLLGRAEPTTVAPEAPYKVETPVAVGEPPATVVVEGAGAVEIPTEAKPAKKAKAPKAKKPAKVKTEFVEVRPEEPGVYVGNYSIRTVHPSGRVDFAIDWDRLREYMKTV